MGIQKLKQKILCYTKFGIYAHIHHSLFKGSFRFLFGRSDVCPNIESSPLERSSFLRFNLLQIIVINAIHDTLYKRVNFLVSVIVFCFCFWDFNFCQSFQWMILYVSIILLTSYFLNLSILLIVIIEAKLICWSTFNNQ